MVPSRTMVVGKRLILIARQRFFHEDVDFISCDCIHESHKTSIGAKVIRAVFISAFPANNPQAFLDDLPPL